MRRLFLALAFLLAPAVAEASTGPCVLVHSETLYSSGPVKLTGTANTDYTGCTGTAGAMADTDDLNVPFGVKLIIGLDNTGAASDVGSSLHYWTGKLDCSGECDIAQAADGANRAINFYHQGQTVFESGSSGNWQGYELSPYAVPSDVRFTTSNGATASSTDITLVFANYTDPEGAGATTLANNLPWALCDVVTDTTCTGGGYTPATTIHAAAAGVGPATLLYFDWKNVGRAQWHFPNSAGDGAYEGASPVDGMGSFYEVVSVEHLGPGAANPLTGTAGNLDSITIRLAQLGGNYGLLHFGADGNNSTGIQTGGPTNDPGAGWPSNGRCEECVTASVGGARVAYGASAEGTNYLRNAVLAGDNQWVVAAWDGSNVLTHGVGRFRDLDHKVRYEIRFTDGSPFNSRREFEGWLACDPRDQTAYDPASETPDRCFRIAASGVHEDVSGSGAGVWRNWIEVWNDPAAAGVKEGDLMHVYAFRPFPGDAFIPVNPQKLLG
ncbi:MAG TPA: hypothetical protein VMU14_24025, partial [Acidimicrobiales bacterium]|nr:hypothetical protein [Acidimicrobiales bacterium]